MDIEFEISERKEKKMNKVYTHTKTGMGRKRSPALHRARCMQHGGERDEVCTARTRRSPLAGPVSSESPRALRRGVACLISSKCGSGVRFVRVLQRAKHGQAPLAQRAAPCMPPCVRYFLIGTFARGP